MKVQSEDGRDIIAGGKIYQADPEGFVEIPDDVGKAEGHTPVLEDETAESVLTKEGLVAQALELQVPGPDGYPAAESVLKRWSMKRLQEAIAAKE